MHLKMNVTIRDCNGRGIGREPKEYHYIHKMLKNVLGFDRSLTHSKIESECIVTCTYKDSVVKVDLS